MKNKNIILLEKLTGKRVVLQEGGFDDANKVIHPVEKQWHYPIMIKYGFNPLDKEGVGFVRSYRYQNSNGYEIVVTTGSNGDYWQDKNNENSFGYWSSLDSHLKKITE